MGVESLARSEIAIGVPRTERVVPKFSFRKALIELGRRHPNLAEKDGFLYDVLQRPGEPAYDPWEMDKKT